MTSSSTNYVYPNGDSVTVVYTHIPIPDFIIPIVLAAIVLIVWWKIRKRR